MVRGGNSVLRMIRYPAKMVEAQADAVWAAHEDINLITLFVEATSAARLNTHRQVDAHRRWVSSSPTPEI